MADDAINEAQTIREMAKTPRVWGFDLETYNPGGQPDPWHEEGRILTAALSTDGMNFGFLLDHPLDTETTDEQYADRMLAIDAVLSNQANTISCHNLVTFDAVWWMLRMEREVFGATQFDTRIAHSLINENEENSLDALARKYTSHVKNEEKLNRKRLDKVDPAAVLRYNMSDARISYDLFHPVMRDLVAEKQLHMFEFMRRVALVTQRMTMIGVHIDMGWVESQSAAILDEANAQEMELKKLFGDVSFTSPKQLADLLFNKLRLPVLTRSKKTQAPATSKQAFLTLKNKAQLSRRTRGLLDQILTMRGTKKLHGTYLYPLGSKHRKGDGRIHTTFNIGTGRGIGGTVTGRLSSSSPNYQNMPRDARLRGVVVPTPGMVMFDADYSQLELRILAWYSKDPDMLEAFRVGQDLHTLTVARMSGLKYEDVVEKLSNPSTKAVWKEKRVQAKRVNFGIPYGVGPYGLMLQLWDSGVRADEGTAAELIQGWKRTFKGATAQLERWKDTVVQTGQLVTPTGRIRRLPGGSRYSGDGNRVLRQGINYPIQSLAADITFAALVLLHEEFERQGGARLTLTVHDSLMGEYYEEDWPDMEHVVRRIMVDDTLDFIRDRWGIEGIPLAVDVDTALPRWGV